MNKNDELNLYAYLDGELSPDEARAFSERISREPELKKRFEFSRSLRGHIQASIKQELLRQNPQAEEVDLWVSIKEQILQQESKQLASSAIFFQRLRTVFSFPQLSFPRLLSPAFVATSFALVFAFYIGQKAEQYISRDVMSTANRELSLPLEEGKKEQLLGAKDNEVLNMSELSFVGNQVGASSTSASTSRIFRSRLQQASSLPPRNFESAMPSCFMKLNSPLLGLSPKEPIELGIEKQVTFAGVDGTPQRLRVKLLRFIPRSGLADLLDMQVRWLDQSDESLLAENLRITNGSRMLLEAGKKPEEQTKIVLAAQCSLR